MKKMLAAVSCAVLMFGLTASVVKADAPDKLACPSCKEELVRGRPGYPKDLGIYKRMTMCPDCGKEHTWVESTDYLYICEKDKSAYELCDMCIEKYKKPAEQQ